MNDVLYGRTFGDWPYIWFCQDCRASVGCHVNTAYPLGRMADRKTKELRKKAHEVFDRLWKSELVTRDRAYIWLAHELKIDPATCHIAWLSKDQLKLAMQLSNNYFEERQAIIARRKAKREKAEVSARLQVKKHVANRKRQRA